MQEKNRRWTRMNADCYNSLMCRAVFLKTIIPSRKATQEYLS